MEPENSPPTLTLEERIFMDPNLTANSKLLALYMIRADRTYWDNVCGLARALGSNRSTLMRAVDQLQARGIVTVGGRNVYGRRRIALRST